MLTVQVYVYRGQHVCRVKSFRTIKGAQRFIGQVERSPKHLVAFIHSITR
jgi:hypothetical protein